MNRIILVRYGEIILKGLNRPIFENKLIDNIKKSLYSLGKASIIKSQARIFIEPQDAEYDLEEAIKRLTRVFGIVSLSIVFKIPSDFDEIKGHSLLLVKEKLRSLRMKAIQNSGILPEDCADDGLFSNKFSFKVEAKRGDKSFPMESPEICSVLGGYLLENTGDLKVDVHNPDFTVFVEVRENTYIYCDIVPAFGGLPVGANGKGMLLLSGGIDSPVAGWMMAKRGMTLEAVHFYSYPYTSERSKEKVISLAQILSAYCHRIRLHIVPFTELQEELREKCPEDQLTILMRRAMMRIAEKIAKNSGAQALITGESLGQVASQTVQGLAATNAVVAIPVFRPLIGMDKNEVIVLARRAGTYETSILPYEDCCTVFIAKHPKTKPKLKDIEDIEKELILEGLVEKAISNTETLNLDNYQ